MVRRSTIEITFSHGVFATSSSTRPVCCATKGVLIFPRPVQHAAAQIQACVCLRLRAVHAKRTSLIDVRSKGAIQLVILRMHLGSRDDQAIRGECLITGSTVWGKPVAEHHPSIESTLQYLRQRRSSFGEYARLLVSVSLAGRWYTSLKGGNHKDAYAVGAKCKPFEFGTGLEELGSRVTACTEQHYAAHVTREEWREVMSTYEGSAGLAFVFDSELTLYAKVCKARNVLKDVRPIGLAVFDAEFDDWSNTCTSWNKFGNYTLMRTARKSVDAIGALNATHVLNCATLPK
ncbi:uncharacterized protein [Dermacentor andersoni]|uniref:uncharacterized protein n=1 Tax=Dermacentor andersoni TaxID=34620 RepID=UPI00241759CE|nr:uncharacterized protein LOC129386297 [Dermacentor andersoni]